MSPSLAADLATKNRLKFRVQRVQEAPPPAGHGGTVSGTAATVDIFPAPAEEDGGASWPEHSGPARRRRHRVVGVRQAANPSTVDILEQERQSLERSNGELHGDLMTERIAAESVQANAYHGIGHPAPPDLVPLGPSRPPTPVQLPGPRRVKRASAIVLPVVAAVLLVATGIFATQQRARSRERPAGRLCQRSERLPVGRADRRRAGPDVRRVRVAPLGRHRRRGATVR